MNVPKMYRAQIQGHCSLQYISDDRGDNDLFQWLNEWVNFNADGNIQQFKRDDRPQGLHNNVYRIHISFPYRVFTNCGDEGSIQRPTLGKNGIPFIPGSSIKGLFIRACNDEQKQRLCGKIDAQGQQRQGKLRFHGAYPLGDWTGRVQAQINRQRNNLRETRYLLLDLVHPQQERQVQDLNSNTTTAIALISFYKPTFSFEFSSTDPNTDWEEVKTIFNKALINGLGGKTNCGYGFTSNNKLPDSIVSAESIKLNLSGGGVSSSLLAGEVTVPINWNDNIPKGDGEAEFRPQMFKAALRSHISRLLAGASANETQVKAQITAFFQLAEELEARDDRLNIFWQSQAFNNRVTHSFNRQGGNRRYETRGILHIYAPQQVRDFVEMACKFAYVMGGFGKSWRRVSHQKFKPNYDRDNFAIGCHWEGVDLDWLEVNSLETLTQFLNNAHAAARQILNSPNNARYLTQWREAWHPNNVSVYAMETTASLAIDLFHNDVFKYTPGIGGKEVGDNRPTSVSSVWHRMLPISDGKYLEIVTVFRQPQTNWNHRNEGNMREQFIRKLTTDRGFKLVWGN